MTRLDMNSICENIIELQKERQTVVIAIDGRCGAGKTTLAKNLQKVLNANLISMDHFFLQPHQRTEKRLATPGENIDYERFITEVLIPLKKEKSFTYRPFDCHQNNFTQSIYVPIKPITIIEGSYSCHPELFNEYDLHIFLTINPQEQLKRIKNRNGDQVCKLFQDKWIPLEEKYFSAYNIEERCEIKFDTSEL